MIDLGTIELPKKAQALMEPAPYKVGYGGRGGLKSWTFARCLLILSAHRKLFNLCAREIQKSIQQSVHKLLKEQIFELGMNDIYDVQQAKVVCTLTGSEFVFAGIKNNINAIKSMEGIDVCWVEEAEGVSRNSWEVLLPTIRRDPPFGPFGKGSEVWVSFNPKLITDETYTRWVSDAPEGTIKIEMSYRDAEERGWFPDILRRQMIDMKRKDYDSYLNIWEGKPRKTVKGSIYAKELEKALLDKRISPDIKVDRTRPCIFSFDLGKRDMCCWWAWQQVGTMHYAVDFYGNTGEGIDHFLDEIEARKLKVGKILLPHDARQGQQSAAFRKNRLNTIEKQVRAVYPGKVQIVANISRANGINAVRALFPRMGFAEAPTQEGVQALGHYHYKVNENGKRSEEPEHDEASNPADAVRMYAVWLRNGAAKDDAPPPRTELDYAHQEPSHSQSWMS